MDLQIGRPTAPGQREASANLAECKQVVQGEPPEQ